MRIQRLLGRHGWLIAIAAAYLYLFPYFPHIRSANELPRVYLVKAMADDGTFAIDRHVPAGDRNPDISPSRGHKYSNKAPGSSMLAVPAYTLVRVIAGEPSLGVTFWICRVFAGIVPALVFLALLWGFLERFAPDPAIRRLVLIAYALGSLAMTYSILFYSHQLGAVCVGSAWILGVEFVERKRGLLAIAAAGALAGAAALVDYQAVFAAVPVAVYLIIRMWAWPKRELVRAIVLAIAGAAIPIAILLAYHDASFGSPFRTGYDASEAWAGYHQQGFLGITKLRGEAFWGSLFRRDNGLFALAPWLLLALPGGFVLARAGQRGVALLCGAVLVLYVLFISSINFWRGGWGIGPRYITAMLPFLLPLVAAQLAALRSRPWLLGAAAGTIVVGVIIYTLTSATFPYWPESIAHPLYEVTFRLVREGLVAPNLASAFGLTGVLGIVPFLAIAWGVTGRAIVRAAGWRGFAIAVAVGVAWVAAYAVLPRGNLEPKYQFVRSSVLHAHGVGVLPPTR
ncbi:MAG: hypothetical protein WKG01_34805 [Kofleriaceae bacterium]